MNALVLTLIAFSASAEPVVVVGKDGSLNYKRDSQGNRVPDYSFAGYRSGVETLPDVPAKIRVNPGDPIQPALDWLARQPVGENGFRGAIVLARGKHVTDGPLTIRERGLVIRGEGPDTIILARGHDRRSVIRVIGRDNAVESDETKIVEAYVPCGSTTILVANAKPFRVGDLIRIVHPSSKAWIQHLEMNQFPSRTTGSYLDWKPGSLDTVIERTVTIVDGESITFDAPLPMALDAKLSPCVVRKLSWPDRVDGFGVEHLSIQSEFDSANSRDENHAWNGVTIENARDGWVRNVICRHLAGSAVAIWQTGSRVTVRDCVNESPISENGGERRQAFHTCGAQTLFHRCQSTAGRHDFSTGHLAVGPNAFVDCHAINSLRESGGIGSWATGTLFDNVTIDGAGLMLTNYETDRNGIGWASAWSMLWQCQAPKIVCRRPPGAMNWAVGVWGELAGNGHWQQFNEFVKPDSLYVAQLKARVGAKADAILKKSTPNISNSTASVASIALAAPPLSTPKTMTIRDGVIYVGNHPATGQRVVPAWWRGTTLPARATEVGIGVTRFVPGRIGPGLTDDLDLLTDQMVEKKQIVLEHHWGLWTDRRRDDHQMIRRIDGDVWAPFYELPWARSGRGQAWDGLSLYDLTKFNPWYFDRLKQFAKHAEAKGLILVLQMYFQHNILEAGAHWADFPWRPANCLQATGFPEPPVYEGGKRVFMAEAFYDVSHPVRRDMHTRYIRHCLDQVGRLPNVIVQTGEEFTGPKHFVEFWLETIRDWQKDNGAKLTVGLSVPKDIQDAILADSERAKQIHVINIKYWWPTANGSIYNPPGGQNLAPRQQLREWKGPKARSQESLAKAVRELRTAHPAKAITISLDGEPQWIITGTEARR